MRARIIHRRPMTTGEREAAALAGRGPIITNRFGQPGFDPLSSGAAKASEQKQPWVNRWLRSLQPEILSNETQLIVSAEVWSFATPPQNFQPVAQIKLPAPMPVAITLGAWFNATPRIRRPVRFSAELSQQGFAGNGGNPGIFLIEWGVGKSRQYIVTDLAPGSVQIPVAQFVVVSALVSTVAGSTLAAGALAGRASVQIYPGATVPNAKAQYTAVISSLDLGASNFIAGVIPPYGRHVSGQVSGLPLVTPLVAELNLTEGGIVSASWNMFAADRSIPPAPTALTAFQVLREHPLTGGVSGYNLRLRNPIDPGTAQAAVSFGIAT